MKKKINPALILVLVIASCLVIGYLLGSQSSGSDPDPDYIKNGTITIVFTSPIDSPTDTTACLRVASIVINPNGMWSVQCNYTPSKYFPGEVDCVCGIGS